MRPRRSTSVVAPSVIRRAVSTTVGWSESMYSVGRRYSSPAVSEVTSEVIAGSLSAGVCGGQAGSGGVEVRKDPLAHHVEMVGVGHVRDREQEVVDPSGLVLADLLDAG